MTIPPTDGPAAAPPKPRPDLRAVETGSDAEAAAPKPAPRPKPDPAAPPATSPEMAVAGPARLRPRHWISAFLFVLVVLAPLAATIAYLQMRAADQYHSEVAFSVRSEEAASAAAGFLGAIAGMGTGSASDADILYEYVRSQDIVEDIDRKIDLRAIYNRAEGDPVFTLGPDASIEALVGHWGRMVEIAFESGTGILHVTARAFTPEDARTIATAILDQSSALVNELSDQARSDAVRFATEELAEAEANLREMRRRLAEFRRENRIVDPSADVAGQMGLLNALQAELAQALVERDTLLATAPEGDQRVLQANRRIEAISNRIEDERNSLSAAGATSALPEMVGRYEELLVDLEFANAAYTQTLAGVAAARAEARRQSRYLAPHIRPTLAESSLYPQRALLAGMVGLFLLLGWSVLMLIYYNVRDNR
jgi:capsular polysaccharide transport system permease protein